MNLFRYRKVADIFFLPKINFNGKKEPHSKKNHIILVFVAINFLCHLFMLENYKHLYINM